MKLIIVLSIIFFGISDIFVNAKDMTMSYNVKGMMCKMNCPDFIKDEANKVNGVKKCDVNFAASSATITFDDSKIDKNALADLLSENTDNMYEIKLEEVESNQSWWNWIFGS